MSFVNKQQANCKPNGASLEKFREEWLRRLVLHHGIKGSVLRVAIVLSYHINRQTGVAFPGVRTIRKLTGLSLSTISNAVNWLGASGYLDIQRGRTRNATNRYAPMFGRKANTLFAPSEHQCSPRVEQTFLLTFLRNLLPIRQRLAALLQIFQQNEEVK